MHSESSAAPHDPQPVAIVGIGCRFPGGADTPESFRELLLRKTDAITPVPEERRALWSRWGRPDASMPPWGGFLEDIDRFDAAFFGISPREARHIDPQQRLLLEVAWEALEDGGQVPDRLEGSSTGVFIGIFLDEYWDLQRYAGHGEEIDAYTNTGGTMSMAANRLSYVFDFHGPSLSVDTACSSSLVAVHLACRSLETGECTLALAGGVNLLLSPATTMGFARASMLAEDGRCKAFDARADGYVRGEGAGIVVLKPLAAALADGDPIYAVIRGSAVNQDGRTSGMTVPDGHRQEEMLREAYRVAGIAPERVRFVEAHGTGTPVGDPVEAEALGRALGRGRSPATRCLIGSIKTNIGHLEAASGIAGLIKTALALKHRVIPPSLHFLKPNPRIPFDDLGLRVATEAIALGDDDFPAVAGVNAFGFGGANAHVVLEEAPQSEEATSRSPDDAVVLPLSARSDAALTALAQAYARFLPASAAPLYAIAATAGVRRSHHARRLAVVSADAASCTERLAAHLDGALCPEVAAGSIPESTPAVLVFVFTGMGPQWWGMGRELMRREPVFRETLEECDALFRPYTDTSLLDEMRAEPAASRMQDIEVAQRANFALQLGLTALWRAWGIEPDLAVGHSVGEVSAARAAGALSLEDAVRVGFHRGRLQQRTAGRGAMLAVGLPAGEVERYAEAHDGVVVAAVNSPASVTLSGPPEAIDAVARTLERAAVFCRKLPVDVPYHSPLMDPLARDFREAVRGIASQPPSTPLVSTVTGGLIREAELDESYWWDNIRRPVRLDAAFETIIGAGGNIFLQVGPHPVLSTAIAENLSHHGRSGAILASLARDEPERRRMLTALAALYAKGRDVRWAQVYPERFRTVSLPPYPWQRTRYWLDESSPPAPRVVEPSSTGHGLPGRHVVSSLDGRTHFWEVEMSAASLPSLSGHRIREAVVVPAAAYVGMALEAAGEALGDTPHRLTHLSFLAASILPPDASRVLQVVLTRDLPGVASFMISSRAPGRHATWTRHATGTIGYGPAEALPPPPADLAALQARCPEAQRREDHYRAMQRRGFDYEACYRSVEHLRRRDGEAVGKIVIPDVEEGKAGGMHPAILDAAFQMLLAALPPGRDLYLPVHIESVAVHRIPQAGVPLRAHARLTQASSTQASSTRGDAALLDERGRVLIEARGIHLERAGRDAPAPPDIAAWLYAVAWTPAPAPAPAPTAAPPGRWIVFADGRGVGENLVSLLERQGHTCVRIDAGDAFSRQARRYRIDPCDPAHFIRLFEEILREDDPSCRGVIYLWSLDFPPSSETTRARLEAAQQGGLISALYLTQAMAGTAGVSLPLRIVTSGADRLGEGAQPCSVAQATLSGLARVIAAEHPELQCVRIDTDDAPASMPALCQAVQGDDTEPELLIRHGARYVRRLVRYAAAMKAGRPGASERAPRTPGAPPLVRVEIPEPGAIEGLALKRMRRAAPGPGEVEIRVHAAGLNFRDVLSALGRLPSPFEDRDIALGWECTGVVTATGAGVDGVRVGDRVAAIAPPCFATFAITHASLVVPLPAALSFEEGASLPIAWLTARYALVHLGRLQRDERVLIHSASGGVGLAAVRIARHAGAEIFATAGSPEKRAYLTSMGIRHVMDSRSLSFADEIRCATAGRGVDVVLNTLSGDALYHSLSVLSPYGRFLELGKTDMLARNRIDLGLFERNVSYFAIDLARWCHDRPAEAGKMLRETMRLVEEERFEPLPFRTYPLRDIAHAFHEMAQAKHIGKIVLTFTDDDLAAVAPSGAASISSGSTYLITGGLGGLGRTVARWLIDRGARHLVLAGRRGPSGAARAAVEEMKARGAEVVVEPADVAREEAVAGIIRRIDRSMPPLRGVIHAAGVLDDGMLVRQDRARFESVLSPKVTGAWNLHHHTRAHRLDFFVLFSSVASLTGAPGQGNYAAANAFLDALAHYRRSIGLPATSIDWGPWAKVGMAAQPERGGRASLPWLGPIPPARGLEALERFLHDAPAQAAVMDVDRTRMPRRSPFFSAFRAEPPVEPRSDAQNPPDRAAWLAVPPAERKGMLEAYLRRAVARVVELEPEQVDLRQSWRSLGVDSLMAVELKNDFESHLGVKVSATELQAETSLERTAAGLLKQWEEDTSPRTTEGRREGVSRRRR